MTRPSKVTTLPTTAVLAAVELKTKTDSEVTEVRSGVVERIQNPREFYHVVNKRTAIYLYRTDGEYLCGDETRHIGHVLAIERA